MSGRDAGSLLVALAALAASALAPGRAAATDGGYAVRQVASGLDLVRGDEAVHVTALRPDVLRVRIDRTGAKAVDESWAALAGPRQARAPVRICGAGCVATSALTVRTDPATGALTVTDAAGRTVLADAAGAFRREGEGFRLDKRLGPRGPHLRPRRQDGAARPSRPRLFALEYGQLPLPGSPPTRSTSRSPSS